MRINKSYLPVYKYEYSFMAHQGLSDTEITKLIGNLCSALESGGGKVLKQEYWGLLGLAYKINKQEKAHYFMLYIEADVDALSEFKRKLKLNELVMRYLELRRDSLVEGDSPMLKVEDEGNNEKSS